MGHGLGLATKTQISVCKSPFLSAGTAVSLFRAKTVEQRPLLPRKFETLNNSKLIISTIYKYHHYTNIIQMLEIQQLKETMTDFKTEAIK